VKLKDLEVINQRAVYSVHRSYNGEKYSVGSHIAYNGEIISCHAGTTYWLNRGNGPAESIYDFENNVVTFKFSKE
jgi:hypothetical protein